MLFWISYTYPALSAKSRVLKRAGATLFEVWALKMVDAPRLWAVGNESVVKVMFVAVGMRRVLTSDDSSHD